MAKVKVSPKIKVGPKVKVQPKSKVYYIGQAAVIVTIGGHKSCPQVS
jgi:hypothetical protein